MIHAHGRSIANQAPTRADQSCTPHDTQPQWYDYLLIAAIVLFTLEFIMFLARLRARARTRLRLPVRSRLTRPTHGTHLTPHTQPPPSPTIWTAILWRHRGQ